MARARAAGPAARELRRAPWPQAERRSGAVAHERRVAAADSLEVTDLGEGAHYERLQAGAVAEHCAIAIDERLTRRDHMCTSHGGILFQPCETQVHYADRVVSWNGYVEGQCLFVGFSRTVI